MQFHAEVVAAELAMAAPGGLASWTPEFTTAWFENLLPEEDNRVEVCRRFGVRGDDTFGLLAEIGWECAGAVAVLPDGITPRSGSYAALTGEDVVRHLAELPRHPFDADRALRMSLGGAQSKLILARIDDAWHQPIDGAPTTHILKPEPPRYPGLAAAEAWALGVVRKATPAAEAHLLADAENLPTIVVDRFDRDPGADGPIVRVHQEDMCQALGLLPGEKYATPPLKARHPSWQRIAAAVARRAADPTEQLVRLLEQMTVHVALGNTDVHAKNVSVFHRSDGTVKLTPVYDIVPTLLFITQRHIGLPVAGKFVITEITRSNLVGEAATWGVPERASVRAVERVISELRAGVEAADGLMPTVRPDVRASALSQLDRLAASG